MKQFKFKAIRFFAVLFIMLAIASIALTFMCKCSSNIFIGISTTFATLAGAILVFSTLEIQRKSLEEEKNENETSRFDSQFYPVVSSFRMDAANMEIICDYISSKGKEIGKGIFLSYRGEKAFFMASRIFETLQQAINDTSLSDYDNEELSSELQEIYRLKDEIDEIVPGIDELDALEKRKNDCIHSFQKPYLMYKYKITKDLRGEYGKYNLGEQNSILFGKLIERQPTILAKYIQSLRFILYKIENSPSGINPNDYYLYVSCQLGKNELYFLSLFKEFDKITNIK